MPLLMSILGHYGGLSLLWALLVHVAIAVPTGLQLARIAGMKWYFSLLLTVLLPGLGTLAMMIIAAVPSVRRQAEELAVAPPGEAFADRALQARMAAKKGIAVVAPFVALVGAACGLFLEWVSAGDGSEGLKAADLADLGFVNVLGVTLFGILVALVFALFFSADWSNVLALGMTGTMVNLAVQIHFFQRAIHSAQEVFRSAADQGLPAEAQGHLSSFPSGDEVGPGPAWWVFLVSALVAYGACWVYVLLFARPVAEAQARPGGGAAGPGSGQGNSGGQGGQPAMAGAAPQFGGTQGQGYGQAPQFGAPQGQPPAPQFGPGSQFGSGPQFGGSPYGGAPYGGQPPYGR